MPKRENLHSKDAEIRAFIEEFDFNVDVVTIPEDRQYWFLRTEGGLYYSDFFHNGFIAIGYNEIEDPIQLINTKKEEAHLAINLIYDVTKPGRIFNQIERFYRQIKVNDVIMIPGVNSNTIAFGIVKSEVYMKSESKDDDTCEFEKRRKVEWVKEISRSQMDPRMYPMVRPHNTISNADAYGSYIDRTIHDFYIKGDYSHFVIDVKTDENVSVQEFRDLIDGIYQAIDIVNELNVSDVKYTHDDIKLKISVQSQGVVELLTNHWQLMLAAGAAIGVIFGGEFSILGQKIKTEGLKGYFEKVSQQKHEKNMKELDHKHELDKMDKELEHAYLKERLKLEFPNEITPSGGDGDDNTNGQ